MRLKILAFTAKGQALAQKMAEVFDSQADRCTEGGLSTWTKEAFETADALAFVGAAGIAVRAIAPFVKSKTEDPAVLVIDEQGSFVIPILSGHLGGANDLALKIAEEIHATAVLTTATDREGIFAVDTWARREGCSIPNPEKIKEVSSRLLSGKRVGFFSEYPVAGILPSGVVPAAAENCHFALTIHETEGDPLLLIPRILVLGIGCKKGTPASLIRDRVSEFLKKNRLKKEAVKGICSIDIKSEEPGLIQLCAWSGWTFSTYSSEELGALPGAFSSSDFVKNTVGVDNVCERAAVRGSGGQLLILKDAGQGVTIAAAVEPYTPEWK